MSCTEIRRIPTANGPHHPFESCQDDLPRKIKNEKQEPRRTRLLVLKRKGQVMSAPMHTFGLEKRNQEDVALVSDYLSGRRCAIVTVDAWILEQVRRLPIRLAREDLTQGVHLKLIRSLRSRRFRYECSFRTYVARIARYTIIDAIRAKRTDRLAGSIPIDDMAAVDRAFAALEADEIARRALKSLPPRYLQLLYMAFVEELSYEQIGERLGVPPGTVKSRMWACRRKMRRSLERPMPHAGVPEPTRESAVDQKKRDSRSVTKSSASNADNKSIG